MQKSFPLKADEIVPYFGGLFPDEPLPQNGCVLPSKRFVSLWLPSVCMHLCTNYIRMYKLYVCTNCCCAHTVYSPGFGVTLVKDGLVRPCKRTAEEVSLLYLYF